MANNTILMNVRLYETDKNRLDLLVETLNKDKDGRKIKQTDIIRALLKIGTETTPEKLLKKIQEVY